MACSCRLCVGLATRVGLGCSEGWADHLPAVHTVWQRHAAGPGLQNCCGATCRWYAEPQLPARGAWLLPPPPRRTLRLGRLLAAKPPRPSCRGAQMLAVRAGSAAVCMRLSLRHTEQTGGTIMRAQVEKIHSLRGPPQASCCILHPEYGSEQLCRLILRSQENHGAILTWLVDRVQLLKGEKIMWRFPAAPFITCPRHLQCCKPLQPCKHPRSRSSRNVSIGKAAYTSFV